MIRLVRDYELRNHVSVVDVGARRYAADPSLELLCVGYRVRTDAAGWGPPLVAIGVGGSDGRAAVERRVRERGFEVTSLDDYRRAFHGADAVVAHNEGFERAIEDRLFPELAALPKYHTCTASRARRLSLPGSLEDACRVLRTPHQKSMDGHRIMLAVSQPRPQWVNQRKGAVYFEDADRLAACAVYCAQDILAESDLDDYLPELTPSERLYWEQVERRNRRGMRLDVRLLAAMEIAVTHDLDRVRSEVTRCTGDPEFALTNPQLIKTFCASRELDLADLRAETVSAVLIGHESGARPIDEAARVVLEARQQVGGKSSLSKLPRMRARLMADEHVHDSSIYHGAHTGRDTGDGINTLNLPRPYKDFDQDVVVDCLLRQSMDELRARQKASVSKAVASALRGLIIPEQGRKLVVGDYASVEPCCLFTLAGQWDAVEILQRKGDLYCEFGSQVLNRTITKKDHVERTLFKQVTLGCGYGLGEDGFVLKCRSEGITAPEDMIRLGHRAYRERFRRVKDLWYGFDAASKSAIRSPGTTYAYNGVSFVFDGWWLVMTLPSGRLFYYPNARLTAGRFGDEIVYEGWMRIDGRPAGWGDVRTFGARTVENAVQAICRDIMEEHQQEVEAIPGWEVKHTVYDEIVAEAPVEDAYAVDRMTRVMSRSSAWLPRMPVSAEVFQCVRYVKH